MTSRFRELTQSQLQILDNKKAQEQVLELKSRSDVPLLLGVVIDVSGSLGQSNRDQYQAAVQTASEFTKALLRRSDDMVFFEQFSTTMEATHFRSRRHDRRATLKRSFSSRNVAHSGYLHCLNRTNVI